ncbi:flagellar hook-basal body complex protein FliE [Ammoniphilus sp. YIM 78166]|uniref:flagellar hook-basal body complex protein FliE n=1 Tax=Ammoniphilus sp. YIM 78166 TaxID=1644106 RepID=UPI00106FD2BB|nr:flagellar hook-basal body complex protein FliE [Ammoniphilus sp. YIM 78166]
MAINPISFKSQVAPAPVSKTSGEALQNFSSFLNQALENVNKQQLLSSDMTKKIAAGDVQDLHKALIIKEQAGVTLDLTIQVRNKAVEAYQEIMRMSI